jgi:hypothetical protein
MEKEVFIRFADQPKPVPIKVRNNKQILPYLAKLQQITGQKVYLLTSKI